MTEKSYITKVLISTDEYQRLLDIEKLYQESQQSLNKELQIGVNESNIKTQNNENEQKGEGEFVNKIVEIVADKLKSEVTTQLNKLIVPYTTYWRSQDLDAPTQSVIIPSSSQQPLPFNNTIAKSDENDSFDEKKLLKEIPVKFKKNAKELLKSWEDLPNSFISSAEKNLGKDDILDFIDFFLKM